MTSRSRMNGSRLPPIAGGSQAGFLDIHVEEYPGIALIRPSGEVDLHTVPILRNALNSASEGAQHVVVDLSSVKYIDSTGVRELIAYQRLCGEHGRNLVLAHARLGVRRVIDILNVHRILPLFPSIPAALTWLGVGTASRLHGDEARLGEKSS